MYCIVSPGLLVYAGMDQEKLTTLSKVHVEHSHPVYTHRYSTTSYIYIIYTGGYKVAIIKCIILY